MHTLKSSTPHNTLSTNYIATFIGDQVQILHEAGGCRYKFRVSGKIISTPMINGDKVSVMTRLPNGKQQMGIYTLQGGSIMKKTL
jgi:hypothetical protein